MTKILRDVADENNVYNIGSVNVGERTESIDMIGYGSAIVQYTIADIGINAVVGLEISNDNVGFDNADVSDEWITKISNGTFLISYEGKSRYLRFYWVSASGGSPKIDNIKIFGG